ncbi:MAG TPA: ABC transporter substrate-binding protein [Acetobacteraceae bacterium]|nr:ABC transporter substrate-binding protein [Acetobacteraceae bacterium]
MQRRTFLAGLSALAAPHIAGASERNVLRFVPRFGLVATDPVFTTDTVTRYLGLAVFESLYSVDEHLLPRPQMAEGHQIEADGRRWTIRLRGGLRFHDGEPVLARDCVASIGRWLKRDLLARSLAPRIDALAAADDRTITFRLKQPFPRLDFALGKPLPNVLPIMPARLAEADPARALTEVVGSGPFRFLPAEFVPGAFAAFARFDTYEPRAEPPSGSAGGRVVFVDRMEWKSLPDPATAATALATGEIDWVEAPLPDLVPWLRRNPGITVGTPDPYGVYAMLRLNHLQGPTANKRVRQAIMAALDPAEIMAAIAGEDGAYTAPVGLFAPGSPAANAAGLERLGPRPDAEIRAMLREAGYNGEPLVALHATDNTFAHAVSQVAIARFRAVGMAVEDVATDQGTVVQRRNSKAPLDKGGWSFFPQNPSAADHLDPLVALGIRNGAAAWIGWPQNETIEQLRAAWIDSPDPAERARLAEGLQRQALEDVTYVPLGRYFQPSAWRRDVTGILRSPAPLFWNVRKS